jgi:parallel beta-helix repeat protein
MTIQPRRSLEHHPIRFVTLANTGAFLSLAMLLVSCGGGGGSESNDIHIAADVKKNANVVALFPKNGANWNDYVRGDVATASDIACNVATDAACQHGGERRLLVIKDKVSCNGLVATDELSAFRWVCENGAKEVRLISTGLAPGKFLSDLIDFPTKRFKPNKVTVKANGIALLVTSSSIWWTNRVAENNSGGQLNAASTVYLVTRNPNPPVQYDLDADKVALVIQPGLILQGPGANAVVIYSNRHNLWIEGAMIASGYAGVFLDSVRFSMLRNVAVDNGRVGVQLKGASNNTLSGVTARNNTDHGLLLNSASNNMLSGVTASNNPIFNGITLADASNNNTLSGVNATNNAGYGILLANASNNNTLSGVTASNNGGGVTLADSSNNNTLMGITATNNGGHGVLLTNASNNTLWGVTASNNAFGVFLLEGSRNNTISGVTASNNSNFGVLLTNGSGDNTIVGVAANNNTTGVALAAFSGNNTLSSVATSNNDTGIGLSESSNNRFTGLFRVGSNFGDCIESGGTLPGLDSFSCANNGSSDALHLFGISLASSFVGKVTSDDTKNATDTSGMATYPLDPTMFDWIQFDNAYRGWGIDGVDFPDRLQRTSWSTGAGRIWDWSVSANDGGANGSPSCTTPCPALLGVLALPTGNDTLTHNWSGAPGTPDNAGCNAMVSGSNWNGIACGTTFLRNAVEIAGKGGNENNLCESGETCLYTPNIGSYQGHGDLESAGTFNDGFLTRIRLMKYKINGR